MDVAVFTIEHVIGFAVAFALGLGARLISLPPLVGFLIAGFVLAAAGGEPNEVFKEFGEMGVTLMLFTIGLKLKPKNLAAPHIWATTLVHMVGVVAVMGPVFWLLRLLGAPYFVDLDLQTAALLSFALSFSSTVFAVKVLADKGESATLYGVIAVGILIVQDLAAVVFLGFSAGKVPTLWALALVFLWFPGRQLLDLLLNKAGHGELLVLFGMAVALGGGDLFEMVGVKGDLGALILGVMLAQHPKAGELSRALYSFKDLFLVGFFLDIGLQGLPTGPMMVAALLLLLLVPLKGWAFHVLLLRFKLRARTGFLSGLTLANYSEFGLIVAAIAVTNGWLHGDWLTIMAVALSLSFVMVAPFSSRSHELYERLRNRLHMFERDERLEEEAEIDTGDADVVIFGMGRVGRGAYDELVNELGRKPVGVDSDPDKVTRHLEAGRHVVFGSATDADFWLRVPCRRESVHLVLLAMPALEENLFAAKHLRSSGYTGTIGSIARFPEDKPVLREAGVDLVFNPYAEAGSSFAREVLAPGARRQHADA